LFKQVLVLIEVAFNDCVLLDFLDELIFQGSEVVDLIVSSEHFLVELNNHSLHQVGIELDALLKDGHLHKQWLLFCFESLQQL